jgi:hypothetical protein
MFEEPEESPAERSATPAEQAKEKADEFRMQAELVAVFEGPRKFDAELRPTLDARLARDVQKSIGKLDKSKPADQAIIPPASAGEAAVLLDLYPFHELSTGDYHINRRPGEVMIVRWLSGDEVETYYQRLQAHFDIAMDGFKEDERQAREWQQDPQTLAYLKALDEVKVNMSERYLRELIRKHNLFVLSTQTSDEINIAYLCDTIMGVSPEQLVGVKSAPPDEPTERDLAWFFKLFSLRGMIDGTERMCFFAYLQKSDESDDW